MADIEIIQERETEVKDLVSEVDHKLNAFKQAKTNINSSKGKDEIKFMHSRLDRATSALKELRAESRLLSKAQQKVCLFICLIWC